MSAGNRVAVIDIGTNAIRLLVAEPEPGGTYLVLAKQRRPVRLGHGLYAQGRIGSGPMERALHALGKMKAMARGFGVRRLKAVATSAVREATNGPAFCRAAWQRHGVRVQVISADEEGRLACLSAARRFGLDGVRAAIVDIGGGSAEVVLVRGRAIQRVRSLPLGAVRLTEEWVESDPIAPREWRALKREIDRQIAGGLGRRAPATPVLIGSGGTFTSLARMLGEAGGHRSGSVQGAQLTPRDIARLLDRLRRLPNAARRKLPGLSADRADIILAGAAVAARLAAMLGAERVLVNEYGIRDGLVLKMIGASARREVDRLTAVRRFGRRWRLDARHAAHVAHLATLLYDQIAGGYWLPPEARELLEAAALLHEVGLGVGRRKHHRHAYRLIRAAGLPGFSAHEVELIAQVARYHRGSRPKKSHQPFGDLPRDDRRVVKRLAGILRLADALDEERRGRVSGVRCRVSGETLRLQVVAPRKPASELEALAHRTRLFERAFRLRLEARWVKTTGRVTAVGATRSAI